MADHAYISDFLSKVEGTRQTKGYIPCHKVNGGTANYRGRGNPSLFRAMGVSGVTIATGCDLGQTDRDTLISYGLQPRICNLFSFYLGKKRDAAIRALYERPLEISLSDARDTDITVHKGYLDRWVQPAYEKASGAKFDSLPRQAQAVIMSVCFQKGCGGVRRDWPKLWSYLTSQNWQAAAKELTTGFTQYVSRRQTEGKLLMELA